MKFKILLAFIALSFAACSSNDDSAPVNPVNEKNLKQITYTRANGELGEVLMLENNQVKERYLYNESGVYFEDIYTYDDEGRLYKRFVTTQDFEAEQTLVYDNQGKLNYITTESIYDGVTGDVEERSFNYSVANKVIETTIRENQSNSIRTYDLDSNGRVYKLTSGNNTSINEATFTGNNINTQTYITYNTPTEFITTTNTFTYDLTTPVKGEYLNISTNRYGSYIANEALFNSFVTNARTNYVSQITNSNSNIITSYQYEFDADGFPVKVKAYENGELHRTTTITYQ